MTKFVYKCTICGKSFQRDEVRYLCSDCGKLYKAGMPLYGVLEAEFDYAEIGRKFDKSAPDLELFSAVEKEFYPPLPVGNTPFFKVPQLGQKLGMDNLWLKNETLNPSGSLKDRASFLVAAEAIRLGQKRIVAASTGNAACALSAVCASAGLEAVIFAPAAAPQAKLVQIVLYGAKLIPVKGTYDDAFKLSLAYTDKYPGLNRNTGYHPLTIEGKKTAGLEIFVQNGCKAPEVILVSVGDGVIISGIYKAFYDLQQAKLIDKMPRLIAVQAETSDAIHNYIETGICKAAENVTTICDSISVSMPSCAHLGKRAVEKSGGCSVVVSDTEILNSQQLLASTTGVFAEPSSAAALAGLRKCLAENKIDKKDQVVLLITGHGLKDINAAMKSITLPAAVENDLDKAAEVIGA